MTKDELIEEAVARQVKEVNEKRPPFRCYHEAWGFLNEEITEVKEAALDMDELNDCLDEDVRKNKGKAEWIAKAIRHDAMECAKEAIDVMTVCDRWLDSLKDYDGSLD